MADSIEQFSENFPSDRYFDRGNDRIVSSGNEIRTQLSFNKVESPLSRSHVSNNNIRVMNPFVNPGAAGFVQKTQTPLTFSPSICLSQNSNASSYVYVNQNSSSANVHGTRINTGTFQTVSHNVYSVNNTHVLSSPSSTQLTSVQNFCNTTYPSLHNSASLNMVRASNIAYNGNNTMLPNYNHYVPSNTTWAQCGRIAGAPSTNHKLVQPRIDDGPALSVAQSMQVVNLVTKSVVLSNPSFVQSQPNLMNTQNFRQIVNSSIGQPQRINKMVGVRTVQPQISIAPRPVNALQSSQSITLAPGYQLPQGTMLMKNEQGQFVLFQANQNSTAKVISGVKAPTVNQGTGSPIQTVASLRHPVTSSQTATASTSQPNSYPALTTQQLEHVTKCKNFLSTLLKLARSQPNDTVKNVRDLIQKLIDGRVEPEGFTEQLQIELKSSPQPNLVPFLKKSLPPLRVSLSSKEMEIEGIHPPQKVSVSGASALQSIQPAPIPTGHTHMQLIRPLTVQQMNQIRGIVTKSITFLPNSGRPQLVTSSIKHIQSNSTNGNRLIVSNQRDKRKADFLREDDDINDVAAMGGVNLSEESRNILAQSSHLVTPQERSFTEESFLFREPLIARICKIGKQYGIESVSPDVASLISCATQERLRDLASRLSVIVDHRTEIFRMNAKYEPIGSIKDQLKFLDDLDKLEKKKHAEQERELLLRAAKSRSKVEDPEQAKLKQKAKELQQAELEEVRQRDANRTALAAIGPRKKKGLEISLDTSQGSTSQASNFSSPRAGHRGQRIRKVTLRDLLLVLEQEPTLTKSRTLYQAFLK